MNLIRTAVIHFLATHPSYNAYNVVQWVLAHLDLVREWLA